jgi:hypothetical protein
MIRPGETQRLVAGELETLVAPAVALEGLASAVGLPAVHLDNKPLSAPEEVGPDGRQVVDVQPCVDFRSG